MTLTKIYHCEPWTPRVKETADKLVDSIHAVAPELETLFMGAAALGLPGKNDIDLDILCEVSKVPAYTAKLKSVLGDPKECDGKSSIWSFDKDGFEVDAILSDPSISHVPLQKARFDKLKSSAELLDEYRHFKISSDGLPYDQYEKQKQDFLESHVVAEK